MGGRRGGQAAVAEHAAAQGGDVDHAVACGEVERRAHAEARHWRIGERGPVSTAVSGTVDTRVLVARVERSRVVEHQSHDIRVAAAEADRNRADPGRAPVLPYPD